MPYNQIVQVFTALSSPWPFPIKFTSCHYFVLVLFPSFPVDNIFLLFFSQVFQSIIFSSCPFHKVSSWQYFPLVLFSSIPADNIFLWFFSQVFQLTVFSSCPFSIKYASCRKLFFRWLFRLLYLKKAKTNEWTLSYLQAQCECHLSKAFLKQVWVAGLHPLQFEQRLKDEPTRQMLDNHSKLSMWSRK